MTGMLRRGLGSHLKEHQLELLAGAVVGIAGAGGLGSNCAAMLVRSGIRNLVLADHDHVEPSNLNRQWFTPQQVGKPKVRALADNLYALEPELVLSVHQVRIDRTLLHDLFGSCSVVVEAVDDAATKSMIVSYCMEHGIFFVSASGMGGWGGPGMQVRGVRNAGVVVGDMQTAVVPGVPPMAPRVQMAAAMQADAVLCRILGPCVTADCIREQK